jgi:hypothetical protein
MSFEDYFIGKRNLYGPLPADQVGTWDLEDITTFRHYNFIQNLDAADDFFDYNVLLLNGDGTNNGQNNTLLDSSTNNRTLTRSGELNQGSFSPYNEIGQGNFSTYFDGTGDYLSVADNSALDMEGSNFTIEGFYFPIGNASSSAVIFSKRANSSTVGGVLFDFASAGLTPRVQVDIGGSWALTLSSTIAFTNCFWNHFAIVRNGNTFTLYINGVSAASGSNTGSIPNNAAVFAIGANGDGTNAISASYISNFRVVKGTAVYTSTFTLPSSPLTAITNTSLLTCKANRALDLSSNAFTVTVNGNPKVRPFVPFNPTAPYNSSTMAGSGYFDGTGDFFTFTTLSTTGAFTCECWFYRDDTNVTNYHLIFGGPNVNAGGLDNCQFYVNNSGAIAFLLNAATGSGNNIAATGTAVIKNQWNHLVWVRDGSGNVALFVNGSRIATSTTSTEMRINTVGSGGSAPAGYDARGYISSVRMANVAIYDPTQTTCTVPTSLLTGNGNTHILANFTNSSIIDYSGKNTILTGDNARVNTAVFKYGTSSVFFDGTNDYLRMVHSNDFEFGTGDFTIELWLLLKSFADGKAIVSKGWPTALGPFLIYTDTVNNRIAFYSSSNGSSWDIANAVVIKSAPALDTWYHIAVTRSGNTFRTYCDGTQIGTVTSSSALFNASSYPLTIGGGDTGGNNFYGHVDDLRITKGYARYTTNSFTPPTRALALR